MMGYEMGWRWRGEVGDITNRLRRQDIVRVEVTMEKMSFWVDMAGNERS